MGSSDKNIQRRVRGQVHGQKFQKRASKKFLELQNQIVRCLQQMDHQLLLVFKVMDYISSIDNKLGRPVNNYYYTAKFSFQTSIHESKSFAEYMLLRLYLFKTLFLFKVYEFFLRCGLGT